MVHGVRLRDGKADWYRNRWVHAGKVLSRAGRARSRWPDPQRHGLRGEHERDRPRGQDARDRRGRRTADRAELRARDVATRRLRRHVAERVHGASEARSRDRRAARGLLLVGARQPGAVHRRRRRRARSPRSCRSRRPARRCCTTWVSQSGTSSCSTCRACSTSTSRRPGASRTSGTPRIPRASA